MASTTFNKCTKVSLTEVRQMALDAKESLWQMARDVGMPGPKIYLHWTGGWYNNPDDDYTFLIAEDGTIYATVDDLSTVLAHTYHRNSGSIGIGACCCALATTENLGDAPLTDAQIEAMAMLTAVLAKALDLTININWVMTHGEAGDNLDGESPHEPYGPDSTCERWDLAILKNGDEWKSGGDTLRGKANWYSQNS